VGPSLWCSVKINCLQLFPDPSPHLASTAPIARTSTEQIPLHPPGTMAPRTTMTGTTVERASGGGRASSGHRGRACRGTANPRRRVFPAHPYASPLRRWRGWCLAEVPRGATLHQLRAGHCAAACHSRWRRSCACRSRPWRVAGLISTSIRGVHVGVLDVAGAILGVRGVLDLARWRHAGYTTQIEEWMEQQKRVRIYELGSLPPFLLVFATPPVGARSSSGGRPRLWRGRGSAPEVHARTRKRRGERTLRPRSLFPGSDQGTAGDATVAPPSAFFACRAVSRQPNDERKLQTGVARKLKSSVWTCISSEEW
jgi:hypothetical protein